jgi:Ca2+-binding RTX toxin-like protein
MRNGGHDTDTFVLHSGVDRVWDFVAGAEVGHDVIDLSAYDFNSLADVLAQTEQDGGSVIHYGWHRFSSAGWGCNGLADRGQLHILEGTSNYDPFRAC